MKLSELQSCIASALSANASIAALGGPVSFSLLSDDAAIKQVIEDRIATHGVCIEVGLITTRGAKQEQAKRRTATFSVYVCESAQVAHTPSDLALVDEVIATVEGIAHRIFHPICTEQDAAKNAAGHVLHVLDFEAQFFDR